MSVVSPLCRLTENQVLFLRHLARFKYLTASQLITLGIASHRTNIHRIARPLALGKTPLLSRQDFGPKPGKGRYESVFYLTSHGASWLVDSLEYSPEQIRYPVRCEPFNTDYEHRVRTNDFLIAWHDYAERSQLVNPRVITYFDYEGANHKTRKRTSSHQLGRLRSLAKIDVPESPKGSIIPDVILSYQLPDRELMGLVFVEIANGNSGTLHHVMGGIHAHAILINSNHAWSTLGLPNPVSPRVLYVFEQQVTLDATARRILSDRSLSHLHDHFLLATQSDALTNFNTCWKSADGRNLQPFLPS